VPRRAAASEELNLVPIMNLVTILIPFLLMSAQFVEFAIIESTLPAICADCEQDQSPDKPMRLTVQVDDNGIVLDVVNSGLPEYDEPVAVPCLTDTCAWTDAPSEAFDVPALTQRLAELADAHPDTRSAILVPGAGVTYEELVLIMDAIREDASAGQVGDGCRGRCLFPAVTLAGGTESG